MLSCGIHLFLITGYYAFAYRKVDTGFFHAYAIRYQSALLCVYMKQTNLFFKFKKERERKKKALDIKKSKKIYLDIYKPRWQANKKIRNQV